MRINFILSSLLLYLTISPKTSESYYLQNVPPSPKRFAQMDSLSLAKYINTIISERFKYILCNKVTVLGMVICPYDQMVRLPEFSDVKRSASDFQKNPIKDDFQQRKTQKQYDQIINRIYSKFNVTKRVRGPELKRKVKRTCMEGKYEKEIDKCLTFDSRQLTFEDAEYFCHDLAPGGSVWSPISNPHASDVILLKNELTPVQYSIWINALHLRNSVVGDGLFDSHLRKLLNFKDIRGTPEHKSRVVLTVEENQPLFTYVKENALHSVVCQTHPIFLPEL